MTPGARAGGRGERLPRRAAESGVTLAALMVLIAVSSLGATAASTKWSFIVQRELEAEAIFRGQLIALALTEFQVVKSQPLPPSSLELLTKQPKPILRRIPADPLTARYESGELLEGTGEWTLVHQGATNPGPPVTSGPIIGVRSASDRPSIRSWDEVPAGSPHLEWRFLGSASSGPNLQPPTVIDPPWPPGFGGNRAPGSPPVRPTAPKG